MERNHEINSCNVSHEVPGAPEAIFSLLNPSSRHKCNKEEEPGVTDNGRIIGFSVSLG